ncbi:ATP-binding protein [Pedobacter sp. MC2016-24]|uniref:ATP-binding protein n=1 Tax=Pedobacter sp. MC2016-24 TaxID=2780090 RepID=UPI00187F52C0|nr:ATP-binding protein [Pedobacter sp. MC2016-24]MBE9601287.1 ATP-binding protein [Pedobacter sp. MC2016-24]
MFQRPHIKELISRIKEPRKHIQVIMGPRQVGKTTMVNQLTKEIKIQSYFVSADAIAYSDKAWLVQQWEVARQRMDIDGNEAFLFIVDEIQKINNWSETVKLLWDTDSRENRPLKVILLGSSRLLLQQGLTESLAGRFETTYMAHWSYTEMNQAFGWTLDQYIWFGGYPGSGNMIQDEERWKNYINQSLIETSISKDILMLTRVDKPALMRRLFELGCLYSGQILSFTKILGQLQDAGNTVTLSHYLELLDTAGLLGGIEKYAADIIRKRSSSPKFQVHNTALISAQRNEFFEEISQNPKEWGRMVESAIGAHLVNSALTEGFKIYYWRERNEEVDFVLERRNKVIAIEVKSGADQSNTGLNQFQKQFKPDKILLIGKTGLSVADFLSLNPVNLFK